MYYDIGLASSSFLLSTCMRNETKRTQCIPLLEEGMKVEVLSTFMLEARRKVDFPGKSSFDVLKAIEEVDIVVEFEEGCSENVALCVKARDKIFEDNVANVSLNVGTNEAVKKGTEWKRKIACNLLEQHNEIEGEDRMDSLWEIYALLDMYQSDSTTKPAEKDAVVFGKKKKKRTRKLDYYGKEEDDAQMQTGCLPFKCSARKMVLGMGRNQIVRISKAVKGIDLFPLHHVMKRRAWQKGQILI